MSGNAGLIGPGIENKDKSKVATTSHLPDKRLWLTFAAVVIVLLLLASVAYVLTRPEKKELSASVSPNPAETNAGMSLIVEAIAHWGDDPIVDTENLAYSWALSDDALGTIMNVNSRQATFNAGEAEGIGVIGCNVSYTHDGKAYWFVAEANITVGPPVLVSIGVVPSEVTLLFDTVQVFNATAVDSIGENVSGANIAWTVAGIPEENYTLNTTTGPSVNFSANATGTVWVNATLSHNSIVKSASATVTIISEIPVLDITRSNLPDGVNWTCAEPSTVLDWGDVIILVVDGTNSVNWTIASDGLDGGSYNTVQYSLQALGSLMVYLNITDITGNGTVNAGDFFTLTASGGVFAPSSHYDVTLIYGPTDDVIVSRRFNE